MGSMIHALLHQPTYLVMNCFYAKKMLKICIFLNMAICWNPIRKLVRGVAVICLMGGAWKGEIPAVASIIQGAASLLASCVVGMTSFVFVASTGSVVEDGVSLLLNAKRTID